MLAIYSLLFVSFINPVDFFNLLIISLINPFSLAAWIAALVAFSIPWEYLGLWITGVAALWIIVSFPFNRPYVDASFDFSSEIIQSTNLALFVGMGGIIFVRLLKKHHQGRKKSVIAKRGRLLSFYAYGIIFAYFSYLFFTDFWHNYQPAHKAYGITFLVAFMVFVACLLFKICSRKYIKIFWIEDLYTLCSSFTASTITILAINLVFPVLAIKATKKVIEYHGDRNTKHCIQANRKPMKSWLYLTPLTAWNKPNGNHGAVLRHAVLVIDKNNEHILYHWSYKLRKWEFNSVGFEPGAFIIPDRLKCTPTNNYWSNLPFIFPK